MPGSFDAAYWDNRYAESPSVWGAAPNQFVAAELAGMTPGHAMDLACGEGRNAIWLDALGWSVRAVDFSAVALDKGRSVAGPDARIEWVVADATTYTSPEPLDLALIAYFQVSAAARRAAVRECAAALAPCGLLLVIAHDSRNLSDGAGGPKDPAVLYTAADVAADLDGTGLDVERAVEVLRPVDGASRPAIDMLLRARRPV